MTPTARETFLSETFELPLDILIRLTATLTKAGIGIDGAGFSTVTLAAAALDNAIDLTGAHLDLPDVDWDAVYSDYAKGLAPVLPDGYVPLLHLLPLALCCIYKNIVRE